MHFTFRQLHIFESVARNLSYTRAAEELFLSQPAVSMQIKQLEDHIGLELFEQIGKKVFLTEAGKELYHYSQKMFRELNEAKDILWEIKGGNQGTLTIAVATTATYFALHLLGCFRERFPRVNISLDVANRESLLKRLDENTVDMVIMGKPPDSEEVIAEPFMENPLVVVAPTHHPLAKRKKIPLELLLKETFILRERGSGTRSAMELFFSKLNTTIPSSIEISNNEAIKQAVQAGFGLGIVSQHTLEKELTLKRLLILDVDSFPIMRYWYIVHRENKRFTALQQAFKDLVIQESKELINGTTFQINPELG
ncbi:LysR family transcriptional regulator [Candidatus Nitrosacidococcus tergens]|uniref:RuBisCO operon transcriptional regulator n=1 Tax=Candidatus Nitrosacidococcus tergens TaxID=553981 RepID=A0A7G1Q7X3_9GAMM|nr:LysR family transcriptional regulator [Candidatus Nitrosacidococcus tergens]CAB1274662.1 RuBisCO operon transcriptional regulator [Candidatus Nitrosacidococcus tergens]